MHLNAEGVGGGATEDSRRATSLPSPLVSASLSLVVSHVPFSLLVRAWCLTTDDVRFVMMWISFLINLFVVKGRRFVKGAQILAADFYQKMSSFVPRRIEHQQRKMNNLRNDGEFEKKWNQKESTFVSQKVHLFQSRRQENKYHYDFRTQYLVERG